MKISPAMVELLLRSAKADPAIIELFKLISSEGFGVFQVRNAGPDDPLWARIKPLEGKKRMGLLFRAQSQKSRVTAFVFLEGDDDEVLGKIARMSGVRCSSDGEFADGSKAQWKLIHGAEPPVPAGAD